MSQPPPRAFLVAFGDSSITLEVGFWIPDPQNGTLMLTSAINLGVYRAFKQAGIDIPVPQREISIKKAPKAAGNIAGASATPAPFAPPSAAPAAQPPRPHDA